MLNSVSVSDVLMNPQFPPSWPYRKEDFRRQDESSDTNFYASPRFVYHIDEPAVKALNRYYTRNFPNPPYEKASKERSEDEDEDRKEEDSSNLVENLLQKLNLGGPQFSNKNKSKPKKYNVTTSPLLQDTSNSATSSDRKEQQEQINILDICSSWVSHYPIGIEKNPHIHTVGMGMNEQELLANSQLNEYHLQDLNVHSTFPFPDDTFDIVTCVVSVDYLIDPKTIFEEIARVLKKDGKGKCIMTISNRCFPTKAIKLWLETSDMEHVFMVGSFFHYTKDKSDESKSMFGKPFCIDLSPSKYSDPLFIIEANTAASS